MKDKKFYWIKLKTDFFNQDTIDFLLSQKNGCEYIVLYQMLCLKTANNNGLLAINIGEMIIPYDVDKIARETKYFDTDTILVALELFKKLGLIYQEDNQILKISDFENMVGSECSSAKRVRKWREKKKMLQCNNDVTQEIENRDKSIEIDKDKENIYEYYESVFGRTLNAIEYEEITNWLKDKTEDEIKKAIDGTALSNIDNIKYIKKVLYGKQKVTKEPHWLNEEIQETNQIEDDEEFNNFLKEFRK